MPIKKMVASFIATTVIGIGAVLMFPQAASASTSVNMNLVCQQNYGNDSFGAKLVNSSSVYGWRCWNRAYPEQYWLGPFFDADVNYYCWAVEGTSSYFTNVNDPYSWRCY